MIEIKDSDVGVFFPPGRGRFGGQGLGGVGLPGRGRQVVPREAHADPRQGRSCPRQAQGHPPAQEMNRKTNLRDHRGPRSEKRYPPSSTKLFSLHHSKFATLSKQKKQRLQASLLKNCFDFFILFKKFSNGQTCQVLEEKCLKGAALSAT